MTATNCSVLEGYLDRREMEIAKFHPQWDFTIQEINDCNDLLKRDLTPICIPPSWDLVQKYAGASDNKADGFDEELYRNGKSLYIGDQGESEFLDIMTNLPIGGILIGDISYLNIMHGHKLSEINKEYYHLPRVFIDFLKKNGNEFRFFLVLFLGSPFQFDFIYVHEKLGIVHIEVKSGRHDPKMLPQVNKQKQTLKSLFALFCNMLNYDRPEIVWNRYFHGSILYHNMHNDSAAVHENTEYCEILHGKHEIEKYFDISTTIRSTNVLKVPILRKFIVMLAGYRPNFFVSPMQCALQMYENIFTHQINTLNYYIGNKSVREVQNVALNVKAFLQSLKFVQCVDINLGVYKNFYLTVQQMHAVGRFDEDGKFTPIKQVIFGPPGSGKSLILMIKMFILGQMESRKERELLYVTNRHFLRTHYSEKLQSFVNDNKNAFCRKVESGDLRRLPAAYDILCDEAGGGIFNRFERNQWEQALDQIVMIIVTGRFGDKSNSDKIKTIYGPKYTKYIMNLYEITELKCIFRSSVHIQNCFQKHRNIAYQDVCYASGHNFNGIKVEWYTITDIDRLEIAVDQRIQKLINVENCKTIEIGIHWNRDRKSIDILTKYPGIFLKTDRHHYMSAEFPVMVAVNPSQRDAYLLFSRAMCHLIVFAMHMM